MPSPEIDNHSFVIRIWLEEPAEETGQELWRGHITHVVSGNRAYFQDLDGIISFLIPYLGQMGVRNEPG